MSLNNDTQLRIAVVGAGGFMFNTLYPMVRFHQITLAAVCDTDSAHRARFAAFYRAEAEYDDYTEMLKKVHPDAVICAVNAAVHYGVAKQCLQLGIPVFVEKTPCETSAEAQELASLQTGKAFDFVSFNRRYATSYILARDIISRPEFGSVAMYYSKFNANPYGDLDRFIFNHIIHHLDLARFLVGELTDIAVRTRVIDASRGAAAFDITFTAASSGAVGTIQSAGVLSEAYPMERLDIAGTGGNVVVDNVRDLRYNRTGPCRDKNFAQALTDGGDCLTWNLSAGYGIGSGIFSYLGFEAELAEFFTAIVDGKRPACTIDTCVGTMKAMEEVRRQFVAGSTHR
jgi:predicted dehydrogenase